MHSLSPHTCLVFAAWIALCAFLGVIDAGAVNVYYSSLVSVGSTPPHSYHIGAGQCDSAVEINFGVTHDPASGTNAPVSGWGCTITDVNGNTVNAGSLHHNSVIPWATIVDAGGTSPKLDMTGLSPGLGVLTLTRPDGTSYSYPFEIVPCNGGVALKLQIGADNRIAPNRAMVYVVSVVNYGPGTTASATVDLTDILPANLCTVTPITPGLMLTSQKLTMTFDPLTRGESKEFWFLMQATSSAIVGTPFTVKAAFTSVYSLTDSRTITVVASIDPNAKFGPSGEGEGHDILKNTPLPYRITFENDPSALAPAQIVTITDYLDITKVEPFSLGFGPVHFGNQIVTPPAGVNPFSVTVPYDVDGNPGTPADNIYVRISGSVNQNKFSSDFGKVVWTFESLDAPNGNPPDISIGFLPPNLNTPEGDGGVSFTVMQVANLPLATLITNVASIVFDVNAPILTPVWTNTISNPVLPTVAIEQAGGGMMRVIWTGGVLEQASTVTANDWTNSPVQISPWTFDPSEPLKFFRVRKQ